MKKKILYLFTAISFLSLTACKKDENKTSAPVTPVETIYTAGFERNNGAKYVAKYWKNATAVRRPYNFDRITTHTGAGQ